MGGEPRDRGKDTGRVRSAGKDWGEGLSVAEVGW